MADQALNTEVAAPVETSTPADTGTSERTAEPVSRREARRAAKNGGSLDRATREASKDVSKIADGAVDAPGEPAKPWEAPNYARAWDEQKQRALREIATREDLKDHWKTVNEVWESAEKNYGHRNNEVGKLRERFGPIAGMIGQMEESYRRQGMSLENGLGQLWQTAQDLSSNPDETMARISQMVKPRNPGQVLQFLAQTWGQNIGELAQGQPYIDPVIAKQLRETQSALQQVTRQNWERDQAVRQQQHLSLVRHIEEFEHAKDASGNLKHPYAAEVGQDMGLLLQTGRAQSLEQAYEIATKLHPKAQEERQKAAEKAARETAARTTTDAEQARNAGRNIASKANGREHRAASMKDAILQAERQTFGKTR